MVNQANNGSPAPIDDIPEALRETVVGGRSAQQTAARFWGMVGVGAMALVGSSGLAVWRLSPPPSLDAGGPGTQTAAESVLGEGAEEPESSQTEDIFPADSELVTLLGHRAYEEASPEELVSLTADGGLKLRKAAAEKVTEMLAQARRDGVNLQAVSGFRSTERQNYLFFDIKAERGQSTVTRAEVSAPPGYSEHHTGYAVDFVDGSKPETDLEQTFEETPAFQWLEKNAPHYGFELSFPKDSSQAVSYEPWHWRFVGDQHSLETFYK